jgi:hypothetical protein
MPCTYCGGEANEQSAALVGIDRIDSAVRRYALANCVPCCATCNFIKGPRLSAVFFAKIRPLRRASQGALACSSETLGFAWAEQRRDRGVVK